LFVIASPAKPGVAIHLVGLFRDPLRAPLAMTSFTITFVFDGVRL